MMPSDARSFLLKLTLSDSTQGIALDHWEFSPRDEKRLFEFIHPSVNTRAVDFRLFNLPITWNANTSALVDTDGRRRQFNLEAGEEIQSIAVSRADGKLTDALIQELRSVGLCGRCEEFGRIGIGDPCSACRYPGTYAGAADHMGTCWDCFELVLEKAGLLLSLPLPRVEVYGGHQSPASKLSRRELEPLQKEVRVCKACAPFVEEQALGRTAYGVKPERACGHCGRTPATDSAGQHATRCNGCLEVMISMAKSWGSKTDAS